MGPLGYKLTKAEPVKSALDQFIDERVDELFASWSEEILIHIQPGSVRFTFGQGFSEYTLPQSVTGTDERFMRVERLKVQQSETKPYVVRYGYCNSFQNEFATFVEALAFYRGYLARCAMATTPRIWRDHPSVMNTDNLDGADDAKPWAQLGLTEAEWDEVQGVE